MKLSARLQISVIALAGLSSCGGFGQVNQGQVVEYRRAEGLITLISDSNYRDPAHPRFDVLPPVTIRVPENPREMGPEPEPGKLLALDSRNGRAVIFDPGAQALRSVELTIVSERSDVRSTDARVAKAGLPLVDRTARTITTYVPRERKLITFSVPEEYLGLPGDVWKVGDEIRYYYKDAGRALRLMNVTRTDLNKAGE